MGLPLFCVTVHWMSLVPSDVTEFDVSNNWMSFVTLHLQAPKYLAAIWHHEVVHRLAASNLIHPFVVTSCSSTTSVSLQIASQHGFDVQPRMVM